MAGETAIEWADATWNPIVGCAIVSPGCKFCYAMGQAARIERMAAGAGRTTVYAGLTEPSKAGPVWNGKVALADERTITAPLRWTRPRRIFANSMGDLFAEGVTDHMRDVVWAVMARAPQHTFIVLTKRAAAMRAYVSALAQRQRDWSASSALDELDLSRPLPNVWLGVTAEDQPRADERVPELLLTPAAARIVSIEPMIGPVDLTKLELRPYQMLPAVDLLALNALSGEAIWGRENGIPYPHWADRLDWVIVGGESGRQPGVRPMHPAWARKVRDDCAAAGVPFFFKQWGEWVSICEWPNGEEAYDRLYHPAPARDPEGRRRCKVDHDVLQLDGARGDPLDMRSGAMSVFRVGKPAAPGTLDGVVHHAWPEAAR